MKPVILFIFVAILAGCRSVTGGYPYRIIAYNESDNRVSDFRITEGKYEYGKGILIPHAQSTYSGPIPSSPKAEFTVSWADSEGYRYEQKVIPRKWSLFQGEIVFILQGDAKIRAECYTKEGDFHRRVLYPRYLEERKQKNEN